MEYCARCLYPENAKPAIIFDEEGICSGCRYHESRGRISWKEREAAFRNILEHYKKQARAAKRQYDCIIPVSGGKDSHYQVYLIKEVYGLNPLLVTFNHGYNTAMGIRNLNNIVSHFGCDLIRFNTSPHAAKKISRYMMKKVGDITWHYHAGIRTFPFQIAVSYNIPLIIWGEHGFAELTGMFSLEDMVEFTKWTRQEHDMRGYEPHQLINVESGITEQDIAPYIYPSDEDIERVGIRGIYLSNYISWNALEQAHWVVEKCGFGLLQEKRERSFVLYAKSDDHANDVHDYLKYLKFGYGRATDDASMEIRHGRMTREEGIELVRQYDSVRPKTLDTYLRFLNFSEEEFLSMVEPMRDLKIWKKKADGLWTVQDSVMNHRSSGKIDKAKVPLVTPEDRTFGGNHQGYYWNDSGEVAPKVENHCRGSSQSGLDFIVL